MSDEPVRGALVLDDRVVMGAVRVRDGWIDTVDVEGDEAAPDAPVIAPGFVDVHVHGWGGHDAMGDEAALDGMARALLRRGVTSFLPTAVTAPFDALEAFAERVRRWTAHAPPDGAAPLGFNLEGPFISPHRPGAQNPAHIAAPVPADRDRLASWLDGWRITTVAPEVPGALELIRFLSARGVRPSLGHSAASAADGRAGYDAGGVTTTHLFNAMTGVDHRAPGLAVAALLDDRAYVELIADGQHVASDVWPLIVRAKPTDRLILVSDALSLAGTGITTATVGGMDVEIRGERCTLRGTQTLAGSVIALDSAIRNVIAAGVPLPAAVAAASRNPLTLLGETDRGRIAPGHRADLVELDAALRVRRVMRDGRWSEGAG